MFKKKKKLVFKILPSQFVFSNESSKISWKKTGKAL